MKLSVCLISTSGNDNGDGDDDNDDTNDDSDDARPHQKSLELLAP